MKTNSEKIGDDFTRAVRAWTHLQRGYLNVGVKRFTVVEMPDATIIECDIVLSKFWQPPVNLNIELIVTDGVKDESVYYKVLESLDSLGPELPYPYCINRFNRG